MSKGRRNETKRMWKSKKKKEWHNNAGGNKDNKEDTGQNKKQKINNKESQLVHHIKEMNEKKIKAIQKENEIRKTQRWRLRIKLQKENTDKITNRTRGKHLQ